MGWLILAIVVVAIIWAMVNGAQKAKIIAAQNAEFLASHEGWDIYISPYNRGVIALSRDSAEVVLGVVSAAKRYRLQDIASVEVLRDGASLTVTNRGSQVAGAAIGGLAFGVAGMLIGGLSGTSRSVATIHSVAIKVIVDDRATPVHVVEFFKSPSAKGTNARSALIKPSLDAAERFHAFLMTSMRNLQQTAQPASLQAPGPADELQKLWELKQAGALTDEEFAAQKARLLPSGPELRATDAQS